MSEIDDAIAELASDPSTYVLKVAIPFPREVFDGWSQEEYQAVQLAAAEAAGNAAREAIATTLANH